MTTNQVQTLKYVKKTSSLSYSCKSCLVSQKCLVRHIYVYPKHSEYDYNPFHACPVEEKKKSIPFVHNELQCKMCYQKNYDCNTIVLRVDVLFLSKKTIKAVDNTKRVHLY